MEHSSFRPCLGRLSFRRGPGGAAPPAEPTGERALPSRSCWCSHCAPLSPGLSGKPGGGSGRDSAPRSGACASQRHGGSLRWDGSSLRRWEHRGCGGPRALCKSPCVLGPMAGLSSGLTACPWPGSFSAKFLGALSLAFEWRSQVPSESPAEWASPPHTQPSHLICLLGRPSARTPTLMCNRAPPSELPPSPALPAGRTAPARLYPEGRSVWLLVCDCLQEGLVFLL